VDAGVHLCAQPVDAQRRHLGQQRAVYGDIGGRDSDRVQVEVADRAADGDHLRELAEGGRYAADGPRSADYL